MSHNNRPRKRILLPCPTTARKSVNEAFKKLVSKDGFKLHDQSVTFKHDYMELSNFSNDDAKRLVSIMINDNDIQGGYARRISELEENKRRFIQHVIGWGYHIIEDTDTSLFNISGFIKEFNRREGDLRSIEQFLCERGGRWRDGFIEIDGIYYATHGAMVAILTWLDEKFHIPAWEIVPTPITENKQILSSVENELLLDTDLDVDSAEYYLKRVAEIRKQLSNGKN